VGVWQRVGRPDPQVGVVKYNIALPTGGTGKRLLTPLSKGGQEGFFEVRQP
jgi:hypothetical protein